MNNIKVGSTVRILSSGAVKEYRNHVNEIAEVCRIHNWSGSKDESNEADDNIVCQGFAYGQLPSRFQLIEGDYEVGDKVKIVGESWDHSLLIGSGGVVKDVNYEKRSVSVYGRNHRGEEMHQTLCFSSVEKLNEATIETTNTEKTEMNKFKLGDKVVVVDSGQQYSSYKDWADKVGLASFKGSKSAIASREGVIVAIRPHGDIENNNILVGVHIDGQDYIFSENGVELVDERTPAQKAGLIIGNKYFVSEQSDSLTAGNVVVFDHDDGTDSPDFTSPLIEFETYNPYINELTPYVEPIPSTTIVFNKVLTQGQIDAIHVLIGE